VKAVTAHLDRLLRLADNATLRSELTLFSLARDAEEPISAEHSPGEPISQKVTMQKTNI
jgi:hypothetical protein